MIVTYTGDNHYLLNAELNILKNKLGVSSDDFSVMSIYGPEITLDNLKMELSSSSLFSDKRLILLEQPSKIKGFDDYVSQMADDIAESTSVVIIEPILDKRKSYFKYLQTNTEFKLLNKLSGAVLSKWAVDYAKDSGGALSTNDASYLIDRVGDDQLMLVQEIQKLILYSPTINRSSINLLSEQSASSTIFELLDAAFSLDSYKALEIYADQRLQNVEPDQILAMLSWQLNTLAIYMASQNLADSEALSKSGLSPYTMTKARHIASKISFSSLKNLVSALSDLDLKHKTATFDLDEGLKTFIVSLSF